MTKQDGDPFWEHSGKIKLRDFGLCAKMIILMLGPKIFDP